MIKVGLIGTGSSAVSHITALNRLKDFRFVGFFTTTAQRKKEFEAHYGVEGFTDIKQFFERLGLDLVVISNVSFYHSEFAEIALTFNVPTLLDKPIDINFYKSDLLVKKFKRNELPLFIALQKRFDEATNFLKHNLQSEIGDPLFTNMNIFMPRDDQYFKDKAWLVAKENSDSGVFLHLGIHAFDQVDWITNQSARTVYAQSSKKNNAFSLDDTISGTVNYQNDTCLNFNFTIATQKKFKNTFEFVGTKGIVKLINDKIFVADENNMLSEKKSFRADQLGSYQNIYEDIFSNLIFHKVSLIEAQSVLKTEKLISNIYQSFRNNTVINSDE